MKAVTIRNIVGGFRVKDVYPIDRSVFAELPKQKDTLTQQTGLAFIPLYSPARTSQLGASSLCDDIPSLSTEEIVRFETRYENGYNLHHDEWYNCWLKRFHPDDTSLQPEVDVIVKEALTYSSSEDEDRCSKNGSQDKNIDINCTIIFH